MKREKFLWPLTQGHHRGLVASRNIQSRIAQMTDQTREKEMALLRKEVSEFWEGELGPHFQAEEEMLGDFANHVGPSDKDVSRILSDHRAMEQLVRKGFKEDFLRFAELLKAHIRFEEENLFGRLEKTLTPTEVQKAGENLRKLTANGCVRIPGPGTPV